MEKHICIDCTLIKNHPDRNAYMDYLVEHNFIHNLENLPVGIFACDKDDYIGYVFNQLSLDNISVPDEHDDLTEMAVLINMDCTRIELLINADGGEAGATTNRIARNAFVKYLEQLSLSKSDDNVVFHLGEVLRDAYRDNGKKLVLPSGLHYVVVDTPFHGDIISDILNNISIHLPEGKIERVIKEALGITPNQAKFDHVFYPDTKCDFQGFDQEYACEMTYFNYRDKRLILFLTADGKGHQAIEIAQGTSGTRVKVDDIHDLKSVIDKEFFNNAPVETPKEEPVEAPKVEPEAEPDISVSIKANTYVDSFHKKRAEIISRTANGEDWLAEFNEIASPKEVVGYYFYAYGIKDALEWWKKNSDKAERTEFDEDVDEIFDDIFCPFCKQKKRMSFGSTEVSLQYQEDGKVNCYHKAEYTGTMDFPICPQCGSKLE